MKNLYLGLLVSIIARQKDADGGPPFPLVLLKHDAHRPGEGHRQDLAWLT